MMMMMMSSSAARSPLTTSTSSTTTRRTMIASSSSSMIGKIPAAALLILLLAAVTTSPAAILVSAEKDGNYYPSGMKNPNVNEKMYWRNSYDVIDDIASFDALYVKFHSCAWSPYNEGCGAEGDDTTWYWGFTSCYRANVGYSLYGALAGRRDNKCSKAAYINSFFTNTGVESFTTSLQQAGVSFSDTGSGDDDGGNGNGNGYAGGISAECTTDQSDDDNNRNKNHNEHSHNGKSYGVGCNSNRFVKRTFSGSYCDGNSVSRTTDNLRTFNSELSGADCVQIYSGGGYDDEAAVGLLENSEACNIRAYPGQCPDPHGKLERYTLALERATGTGSAFGSGFGRALKGFFTWIFFLGGCALYALGMYAIRWREQRRRKASDRRRQARQSSGGGGGVPRLGKMFRTRSKRERSERERSEREQSERESEYESP